MDDDNLYWFPAKRYGWGWGPPRAWQGWVVTILWFTVLLFGLWRIGLRRNPAAPLAFVVGMSCLLMVICYWKGEPPRWRWGEDK